MAFRGRYVYNIIYTIYGELGKVPSSNDAIAEDGFRTVVRAVYEYTGNSGYLSGLTRIK